jgi:hypothetical protein
MTGFSTVKKADVKEVTSSTSSQSPKKNVLWLGKKLLPSAHHCKSS